MVLVTPLAYYVVHYAFGSDTVVQFDRVLVPDIDKVVGSRSDLPPAQIAPAAAPPLSPFARGYAATPDGDRSGTDNDAESSNDDDNDDDDGDGDHGALVSDLDSASEATDESDAEDGHHHARAAASGDVVASASFSQTAFDPSPFALRISAPGSRERSPERAHPAAPPSALLGPELGRRRSVSMSADRTRALDRSASASLASPAADRAVAAPEPTLRIAIHFRRAVRRSNRREAARGAGTELAGGRHVFAVAPTRTAVRSPVDTRTVQEQEARLRRLVDGLRRGGATEAALAGVRGI